MHLKHLSLTNFRNFARLDIDLPRRVILLVGDNAQGKTSILEAIYFLASFTSFQTNTDRQLVNFVEAKNSLAVRVWSPSTNAIKRNINLKRA